MVRTLVSCDASAWLTGFPLLARAVSAPAVIGKVASDVGAWVLYISTDYVRATGGVPRA